MVQRSARYCGAHLPFDPVLRMEVHASGTSRMFTPLPYLCLISDFLGHKQKKTNNLHDEEVHVPLLRSDFKGLPGEHEATKTDYMHYVEETPLFTLFKMAVRQFL